MKLGCFSEADLERIREGVTEAERQTSAEIVIYIVRESGDYPEASWKGALIGAFLLGGTVAVADAWSQAWGGPNPVLWWSALLVGSLVGYLLTGGVPAIRRTLVSSHTFATQVQKRAEAAFLEEQVFATAARTGILLFVALFERRAAVLGDEGVHAAVEPTSWQRVVEVMVQGMESGYETEGVLEAVAKCSDLLAQSGLARAVDDRNELHDLPRLRDR